MTNRTITTMLVAMLTTFILADAASAFYSPRMGRFLNRDPIGESGAVLARTGRQTRRFKSRDPIRQKDEQNTYGFVENAPTNRYDKLGLQSANPNAGLPHCLVNGQPVVLSFDGSTLSGSGFIADAVSGKPIEERTEIIDTDPTDEYSLVFVIWTGVFDYSQARQKLKDEGPIPEGGYWFDICSENNASNRWAHWLKLNAWGEFSWPLVAWPTTSTYGRGGFFIHGGGTYGSAGCIDVARKDKELQVFTAAISKSNKCCCYINVDVKYPQRQVTKTTVKSFY